MINLHEATRNYGKKLAVSQLTLSVPAGELFAFLGPNGAGKTTTIKMLACLLRPSSGTIRVCGHDTVDEPRQVTQCIGYVPDESHIYDKLSGREFLEFVAQMHGLRGSQMYARIDREVERFALNDFLDDLGETYSHGMKQRLVFASAMLHDPAVLLVDEPMVGLDPKSVRLVKDLLRERASAGTTIFMSTHTLAMAEELADRIGIINSGRLRFLGTIDELRAELAAAETSLEDLFLELTDEDQSAVQSMPGLDEAS